MSDLSQVQALVDHWDEMYRYPCAGKMIFPLAVGTIVSGPGTQWSPCPGKVPVEGWMCAAHFPDYGDYYEHQP